MLRKIRVILAVGFWLCITALLLDFTGTLHAWLGWMAKIQFLPAVMALNAGVIVGLILLTLLFGRVYCSVICPLGVMQDIISRFNSIRRKKNRYRFTYSPANNVWRYSVLVLFVIATVAGMGVIMDLLAPYSSYGRIVSALLQPVYIGINNLLALLAERIDSYSFYHKEVWLRSVPVLVIAAVTFVAIFILAWRNGRTYCNTICPVGTVLGFLSRYSLFAVNIDKEKCKECGLCSRQCKASCIDGKHHRVDGSRCVACMDCLDACEYHAITYGLRRRSPAAHTQIKKSEKPDDVDNGRRTLLATGALMAATAAVQAQRKKVDGGLAVIEQKKIPHRHTRIVPPGAVSIEHLAQHCTGCQLCVDACPNNVLRPSSGLLTMMQPESSYERGYCRPECTRCSQVCPSGAIRPIDKAAKTAVHIGHAVWIKANCVAVTDKVSCGNCARHCPAGAIQMVPLDENDLDSPMVPAVNEARCIGCGACENLCPATPFSAIYVEGHEVHNVK